MVVGWKWWVRWDRPVSRRWRYGEGWRRVVLSSFHLGRMSAYIDRVTGFAFPSVAQEERARAFRGALASIPAGVRRLVVGFPTSHLRLLWAARAGGEYYRQLLETHPALAL